MSHVTSLRKIDQKNRNERKEWNFSSIWYLVGEKSVVIVWKFVDSLQIRHLVSSMCIDSPGKPEDLHQPVGLYPCHRQGGNQVHEFRVQILIRIRTWYVHNHGARGGICLLYIYVYSLFSFNVIFRWYDANFNVLSILDGDGISTCSKLAGRREFIYSVTLRQNVPIFLRNTFEKRKLHYFLNQISR